MKIFQIWYISFVTQVMNHFNMEGHEELSSKINRLLEKLKQLLLSPNLSIKRIHAIRVNIKRWKTFFDFIHWMGAHSHKLKNQRKNLNTLFHIAGELRVNQIIQKKLKNKADKNKEIRKQINEQKKDMILKVKKFKMNAFEKSIQKILLHLNYFDGFHFDKLIAEYKSDLIHRTSFYKNFKCNKEIHSFRKLTRKILDANYFFHNEFPNAKLNSIEKIRHFLGLWHDELDLLNYLKKKLKEKNTIQETNSLKKSFVKSKTLKDSYLKKAKKISLKLLN